MQIYEISSNYNYLVAINANNHIMKVREVRDLKRIFTLQIQDAERKHALKHMDHLLQCATSGTQVIL